MITGLLIITGIICIKYRPLYKITINGQTIGYVTNKDNFENRINDYINTQEEPSIAFKTLDVAKAYNLELVERAKIYNEDEVLNSVIDNTRIIYTMYAILIEDQITSYVETGEEAEKVVKELNDEYKGKKIKIGSIQIYSTSEPQLLETKVAVAQIEKNNIRPIVTARSKTTTRGTATTAKTTKAVKTITQETTYTKKQSGINGVIFSVQPVSGIITSKFGGKRGHTGLDIASKKGTTIRAIADGTVIYYQKSDKSYGNMIKISHGNGVESWYAHCDTLKVKKGDKITAGQIIATMGDSGKATGPHLHLEIVVDGKRQNPQKYMY